MNNIEYEYSFNVSSLDKYIAYCNSNGYKLSYISNQTRTIYRKNDSTMARITINEIDGKIIKEIDFKEDKSDNDILKTRRESESLTFEDDKAINSILDFLNYKKDNTLVRKRYVYIKGTVKFELDEYVKPYVTCVVAIEGNKKEVDDIFKIVKDL